MSVLLKVAEDSRHTQLRRRHITAGIDRQRGRLEQTAKTCPVQDSGAVPPEARCGKDTRRGNGRRRIFEASFVACSLGALVPLRQKQPSCTAAPGFRGSHVTYLPRLPPGWALGQRAGSRWWLPFRLWADGAPAILSARPRFATTNGSGAARSPKTVAEALLPEAPVGRTSRAVLVVWTDGTRHGRLRQEGKSLISRLSGFQWHSFEVQAKDKRKKAVLATSTFKE
ncbi:unnamed protein product, partial [Ixodes pacificus]